MRLLTQVSAPNTLDNVKMKCNVGLEFISQLSESLPVKFDLSRYLFDT